MNENIKLCNCADCGAELLGESMRAYKMVMSDREKAELPQLVYCRVAGRPYCLTCSRSNHSLESGRRVNNVAAGDLSPSQENAIKTLEENR